MKKVNRKTEIFFNLNTYNITIQFKFPYTPFIQTSSYFHKVIIWKKWTEKLKFSYTYTISQYNLNFLILHLSKLPPIFTKLLFEKSEQKNWNFLTHIQYNYTIQFKFPYIPFIQTFSYFHKVIIWKKNRTEKLKFSYTISQYNLNFLILHLSKHSPIFTKLLFEKSEQKN